MQWISVKDRLPEITQHCWLYGRIDESDFCEDKRVFHGYFSKKFFDSTIHQIVDLANWDCGDFKVTAEYVTHWMPFFYPNPPKE